MNDLRKVQNAQKFVDDYETIEDTLRCLIDDVELEESKEYFRELLAEYQSENEEKYEENQKILDAEWEKENEEQLKEYWDDQF
jgi:hypothetical protein